MKKAVTLAAIAGLSLASDFEDTEFMAQLPSKPVVQKVRQPSKIFFDNNFAGTESRSKLSIFKKKGESEKNEGKHEADDELMTVMEYLQSQPKVISVPERQILDVRTRVPIVSVVPTEPKTEQEDNKPKERSNFSIFDRKEGEKTEETNHGKSATRSNFSILNKKQVNSYDVQHAKRDLEALVSKLLRHKYVKSDNDLFGLRDLKKGGDKDSNKANVLKLDSEEDNDLYGIKDWRREKDSGKAGVLGLDSEGDNDLYSLRDWKRGDKDSGKAGVLGLDDEGDNEFRVLGNLIHDGLEIYRDVKNKDYGKVVSHGIKAAQDVHELTRKRNFLAH